MNLSNAELIAVSSAIIALLSSASAWTAIILNRRSTHETLKLQREISLLNSRSSVVSSNRQKWIDDLRRDVAEFLANSSHIDVLKKSETRVREEQFNIQTQNYQLNSKVVELYFRISMRLNHSESNHINLLENLRAFSKDGSRENADKIQDSARTIFKDEWERIKKEAAMLGTALTDSDSRDLK